MIFFVHSEKPYLNLIQFPPPIKTQNIVILPTANQKPLFYMGAPTADSDISRNFKKFPSTNGKFYKYPSNQ